LLAVHPDGGPTSRSGEGTARVTAGEFDPGTGLDPGSGPGSDPGADPGSDPVPRSETEASHAGSVPGRDGSGSTERHPVSQGTLELNAVPWAYVSIDGGTEEETPIRGRKLAAGVHKVRIWNPVLERTRTMRVTIEAGETNRVVVDLKQ
jgi:hypothetical protein